MKDNVMRNRIQLLLILSLVIGVNACQSKDDLTQAPIQDGNTVLSVEDRDIISTGGSFSVAFTSNSSWQLKGCPEWLEVNKSSGRSGTTTIKMSARCNETRKDRIANLVFEAQDGSFATPMKVSQTYPYLNVDIDTLSFNWNDCRTEREGVVIDNNPQKIKISSNVAWRIQEIPSTKAGIVDFSHFTLSSEMGKDDYNLDIIPIRDNFYKEPYDVKLRLYPVVRDEDGNETEISATAADSYVLKLHQKNLKFLINDSADDAEVEFSELNDNPNINLNIDSEINWTVAECPSWVVMNKKQGKDLISVNFQADGPNPACDKREGVVRLSTGAGAYRDIYVSQKPYVFELAASDINIGNDDTNEYKFNLTTTGTWEVKDIPSWLIVTPAKCEETTTDSGKSVHQISVVAKGQNLTFEDYSQILRICSSMNDLSDNVPVKQDKFVFNVESANTLSDLPTMNTIKYPASVESSGKWEITGIPDWVEVSQSANEKGTYSITIGAKQGNPDMTKDRSATLSVVSVNHRDAGETVVRNISVKQRKYTFEVTPTDAVTIPAYKNSFDSFSTTIRCSADWSLTQYPSWISPSVTSGDGTVDVTVVLNPTINAAKTGRSGIVTVKSLYNNEEKSISINQDAFVFDNENKYFDVVVMNTTSFPISFDMTDEAGWRILSGYSSWINPSKTSGYGAGSITFKPDPNPNLTERTGTATIHSAVSGEDKVITFIQEKYVFDSDPESYSYSELDKTTNALTITSSGPWTISDAPSWMKLSTTSGSTSSTITISPANNTTLSPRNSTFHIVSTINNLNKAITVSQAAFKFDSSSKSYSYTTLEERTDAFDILSSGKWTAKNIPAWITLSKTSGNGSESGITESVSVTSTKNLTESDRSGKIQIVSNDNSAYVKEISVKQDKFDFRIDNTAFVYTNPLDVTSRTLGVVCPAAWTISSNEPWVSTSVASGDGNGSVTITPQQNLTVNDRSAIITVTSTLNALKRTLTLSQPKFIFEVDKSFHTFDYPIASDNTALSVGVNCSADWTVEKDAEWINLSATSGYGNSTFSVTPKTNPHTSSRSGKVTVKSTLNGLTKTISISQKPFEFNASTANVSFEACDTDSQSVDIVCSGAWTLTNTGSAWLTANQTVTKGNGKVTLVAQDNPNEVSRDAVVTITATDNPSLVKTINVTQKKHTLDLNKASLSFAPYPAGTETFNVTTVGPWTASSDKDWCTVSQSKTSGNGVVTVSTSVNTTSSDRSATITISCNNTTLKKTVTVSQSKYVFDQSSEAVDIDACPAEQKTVNVTSSGRWSVSSNQTWVKATQSVTSGNGQVTIKADANPSSTPRSAVITVTCTDNTSWKKVINVTQAGHEMVLSESSFDFTPIPSGTKTFTITTTGPWTVSSNQTWCTISPASGTGNGTVTVSASTNGNTVDRNATITVACSNSTLKKNITVNQAKYIFDTGGANLAFVTLPAGSQNVDVTSSGQWTATASANWISVTPTSGNGNGTVSISVGNNVTYSDRNGTVTITCSDNNSLKKVVTISQDKFVFAISANSKEIAATATSKFSATVTCSTAWSASSDSAWLSVSQSGSILYMTPEENNGVERTAVVSITNPLNSTILTYTVKQGGIETGD